jgi:NAD(P)-dependent dehydrogenase (short-subunit alcohol dehydrogenase family)
MEEIMSMDNQVAIVTGSGRGIGRAIAVELATEGADVVLMARTEPELRCVAEEVENLGRRSLVLPVDLTDSEAVDVAVACALAEFGKVDVLVNNAGAFDKRPVVPLPGCTFEPPVVPEVVTSRMTDDQWRGLFSANVDTVFYMCRALGPHFLSRRYGTIINVSSNSASQAFPCCAPYNASKAALSMLTRVLALEWAEFGVRVNAIAPGEFHTQLTDFSWSDTLEKAKRLSRIPMHREGDLRDLARMVTHLCGSNGSYITGQIYHIDGGLTA